MSPEVIMTSLFVLIRTMSNSPRFAFQYSMAWLWPRTKSAVERQSALIPLSQITVTDWSQLTTG